MALPSSPRVTSCLLESPPCCDTANLLAHIDMLSRRIWTTCTTSVGFRYNLMLPAVTLTLAKCKTEKPRLLLNWSHQYPRGLTDIMSTLIKKCSINFFEQDNLKSNYSSWTSLSVPWENYGDSIVKIFWLKNHKHSSRWRLNECVDKTLVNPI